MNPHPSAPVANGLTVLRVLFGEVFGLLVLATARALVEGHGLLLVHFVSSLLCVLASTMVLIETFDRTKLVATNLVRCLNVSRRFGFTIGAWWSTANH